MAGTVRQPARPPSRPLLGLRRRPGRLALVLFRMPLRAYHHDKGWLLGHTFLLLTHVGRRTGEPHETVAMVLRHVPATGETVICSAWGPETDWVKNLRVHPASRVALGRDVLTTPDQRFLSDEESLTVVAECLRRHPWRFRLLSWILGWGDLGRVPAARQFVRTRPFVEFRPRQAPDG